MQPSLQYLVLCKRMLHVLSGWILHYCLFEALLAAFTLLVPRTPRDRKTGERAELTRGVSLQDHCVADGRDEFAGLIDSVHLHVALLQSLIVELLELLLIIKL